MAESGYTSEEPAQAASMDEDEEKTHPISPAAPEVEQRNPLDEYLAEKITTAKYNLERSIAWNEMQQRVNIREQLKQKAREILEVKDEPVTTQEATKSGAKPGRHDTYRQYYQEEVGRLEALKQSKDPEDLRRELDYDFSSALYEYSEAQGHMDWLRGIERFDYSRSDADIIAEKEQRLNAIIGDSEAEKQQKARLTEDMQFVREHPDHMQICRDVHTSAVEYKQRAVDKLTQLSQLRQQYAIRPPATSPNVPTPSPVGAATR